MEDLTGKQLGPYQLIERLGEGGMAVVYKSFQPEMERYVALKILPRHLAAEPQFLERFEQEVKIIAKFQHPHILPVFDYGEADGYTYLVMPFIEAGTLAGLIKGKPLERRQIRKVISQIGDALDYAHEFGVVHRDIKPSNILIDSRGNCLLTDFGIAKIVEGSVQLTLTGGVIGTPAYMSPEQIMGEEVDGRSDIYSLGVVLYEMATGRTPYRAETPPALFVKHIHDPLPLPQTLNPELSEAVTRVILKSLAKKPEQRYGDAAEMVAAIKAAIKIDSPDQDPERDRTAVAVLETMPGAAQEPVVVEAPPAAGPPRLFRSLGHGWALAGLLALVSVVIGVGLVLSGVFPGRTGGAPGQPAGTSPAATPGAGLVGEPTGDFGLSATATARLAPTSAPTSTPLPTATPTTDAAIWALEDHTQYQIGEVLFEDDFESGFAKGWKFLGADFDVTQDETGNYVLSTGGPGYEIARIGEDTWQHYAFEYRVKVLETDEEYTNLVATIREDTLRPTCVGYYIAFSFEPDGDASIIRDQNAEGNCPETYTLQAKVLSMVKNRWYTIRISAFGPRIEVSLDGQPVLSYEDPDPLQNGYIVIEKEPGVKAHYDDVRVFQLLPPAQEEPAAARVLFEDDFESGFARNWRYLADNFTVVQDETGNFVLSAEGGNAVIGEDIWQHYSLEYRVKVLETNQEETGIEVTVREDERHPNCEGYRIWFEAAPDRGAGIGVQAPEGSDCPDVNLDHVNTLGLEINQWHTVRISAIGPRIEVSLDGQLVLSYEDPNPLLSGHITISNAPGVKAYYDDVRVFQLLPPVQEDTAQGRVLFEDDFESGLARNWLSLGGGSEVVQDETGNYVLKSGGSDWELAIAGDHEWQDYTLELRVKVQESNESNRALGFTVRYNPERGSCIHGYNVWFQIAPEKGAGIGYAAVDGSVCDGPALDTVNTLSLEPGRWYTVRIAAVGPEVNFSLDGSPIFHTVFTESLSTGGIVLQNVPGMVIYYDDVRVVELSPTASPRLPEDNILFEDDFESGTVTDWRYVSELFSVVQDETGNYVLETDPADFDVARTGDFSWEDYAFEFRVRMVAINREPPTSWIVPGVRDQLSPAGCSYYNVTLFVASQEAAAIDRGGDAGSGCESVILDSATIPGLETGRWYTIRIEAVGQQIAVFLDGQPILLGEDQDPSPLLAGGVVLTTVQGSVIQYDDVRVVELNPEAPDLFLEQALQAARADPEAAPAASGMEAISGLTPDFQEHFSSHAGSRFLVEETDLGSADRANGAYVIVVDPQSSEEFSFDTANRIFQTDAVIQLDVQLDSHLSVSPPNARFFLRQGTGGQYEFLLQPFGTNFPFGLVRENADEEEVYELLNVPPSVETGTGTWHNLIFVLVEDQIFVFIDGTLAFIGADDRIRAGSFHWNVGQGTSLKVDNLRIWNLP